MAQITQDMVQKFIDSVEANHGTYSPESTAKAVRNLDKLPLTEKDIARLSSIDNGDIAEVISRKTEQRYEDVQKALEDFCEVNDNDVTVDDFAEWVGSDKDDVHKIMDKAHVYARLSTPKRPETVSHW